MLLKKITVLTLTIVAVYFFSIALLLKHFLSELIFLNIPKSVTHESSSFYVNNGDAEVLVRVYASGYETGCAIYFSGRHGGVPRYEAEVFQPAAERGITTYAISYPGYEGARGNATYENVNSTVNAAIEHINQNTECKVQESIFIGRSLGSAIALESAVLWKPKGLLLDSVSPSIAPVIREKMKSSALLWPVQILPIEKLLEFDIEIKDNFLKLGSTPIVILQGGADNLTKSKLIMETAERYQNIEIIVINNASHSNLVLESGETYFKKLCQLTICRTHQSNLN